jgi:hypothetical protein
MKLTQKMLQQCVERAATATESGRGPVFFVSPAEYKDLKVLVDKILAIEPEWLPIDPWSIRWKAQQLGIK